jgi:hypothetical protein
MNTAGKKSARRQALIVLGMLRSAPSALVSVIEHTFASAGIPWDSLRRIDPAWFESEAAELCVSELMRCFERSFSDCNLFVIEDPRLCRILPLLHRALNRCDIEPGYMLTLRHPDAVAASLSARDQLPRPRARALWLRCNLDAERWTRDAPRVIVKFGDLMSDGRGVMEKMLARFGLDVRDDSALASAVSEYLDSSLAHHEDAGKEPLPALLDTAWTAMLEIEDGKNSPAAFHELDRVSTILDAADEILGAAYSSEIRLLEETVKEQGKSLADLQVALASAQAESALLNERMRFRASMAQAALERALFGPAAQ